MSSEGAKAAAKHGASIVVWDMITTLGEKIEDYKKSDDPEDSIALIEDILEIYKHIDKEALDDGTLQYVQSLITNMKEDTEPETLGL